jgi:hypothetical protein
MVQVESWPPAVGRLLGAVSMERVLAVLATKIEERAIWVGFEEGAWEGHTRGPA